MSFIFPIISSISIALTCGYVFCKYYFSEKNDKKHTTVKTRTNNIVNTKVEIPNKLENNKLDVPTEYKPLYHIVIDTSRPKLIVPDKTEYTRIPSNDKLSDSSIGSSNSDKSYDDFDIITEDEISE